MAALGEPDRAAERTPQTFMSSSVNNRARGRGKRRGQEVHLDLPRGPLQCHCGEQE